jgi:transcriptional regulator with XRE-family HTH domain
MTDGSDTTHRKQLGKMMKAARRSIKPGGVLFSGARMARFVGVSKDMIERYETGRVKPSLEQLLKYREALVDKGYDRQKADDIIRFGYPVAKGITTSKLGTPIPSSVTLSTQRLNPQWADFHDFTVGVGLPWVLRCRISTKSPYFRFGFKLLTPNGRVFGDGTIQSFDSNLIVHIGRNNWDRPRLGITSKDIFLTAYMSGSSIELDDRFVLKSKAKVELLPIELLVDKSYRVTFKVNEKIVFQHIVAPALCDRLVMYAWGDREEFLVEVSELAIQSI